MDIELIDKLGSDLSVVNAARVSFAKRKDVLDEKDDKLIKYLAKWGHFARNCQKSAKMATFASIDQNSV